MSVDFSKNSEALGDTFAFAPEAEAELAQILARYPPQYKKAAVIPFLHVAQEQLQGWTSIGAMNEVARRLDMPRMRVYEVATFYTMFNRSPVGKYHIQVCTTTPCQLCGSEAVWNALCSELALPSGGGGSTDDGLFTLSEVECAGACVNAPTLSINDIYYVSFNCTFLSPSVKSAFFHTIPVPFSFEGFSLNNSSH